MRIAVLSDTHGNLSWAEKLMPMFDSVDAVIHLGDCVGDAKRLEEMIKCPIYYIAGNCDIMSNEPRVLVKHFNGVKIFAVHGDRYSVDRDLLALSAAAREQDAEICLYGHTHIPDITPYYGVWFVNPGSMSRPRGMAKRSYAIIEIDNKRNVIPSIITP